MTNNEIRKDFSILKNLDIAYLDSGATTQKPNQVINAVQKYFENENANPHRGAYDLSIAATQVYDESKAKVAKFINAKSSNEIIYTRNSTESLNLIAYSYGMNNLNKNDKIVISIMEHHSNLVTWQNVCKKTGASLEYMYTDDNYELSDEEIKAKIVPGVKIVAVTQVSNVLGTINDIKKIAKRAHEVGAIIVVDAAQSAPHMKIDLQDLNADFLVFSGHKMLAPMGIGVLYGKEEILNKMEPFNFGGDMIEYVYEQDTIYANPPMKFEAGTQNVNGAVGLSAAIDYLENISMKNVEKIESELLKYAYEEISKLDFIKIYGPKQIEKRAAVIAFNVKNVHSHDVSTILNNSGVCIRSGHHCAQPLHRKLKMESTCRASFYIYNTKEDIDRLIDGLKNVQKIFSKYM
mgnify:CR=1 FL=1